MTFKTELKLYVPYEYFLTHAGVAVPSDIERRELQHFPVVREVAIELGFSSTYLFRVSGSSKHVPMDMSTFY